MNTSRVTADAGDTGVGDTAVAGDAASPSASATAERCFFSKAMPICRARGRSPPCLV